MDVDLQACIDGDKRAWDLFVERWSGLIVAAVRRTIRTRVGETAEIDDPVQDVFVRLVKDDYRLLRTYDPQRASLSTWLTLVARSTTIDHLRRKRLDTVPLEVDAIAPPPESREGAPPALPLHLLTSRQRLVLKMLFDEGLTVPEAARTLGVDDQTIRSTKHKAISRLREHLSAP
ncbi:MAG: sigma-70 family RNA polymerase sigma factor [Planctomycetes bacterium]|nr:sigma-70 family RNA polymerase sigma factor [Planctomycetota bacterium]